MDSDTPQTALWPTWLGAILLVPLAAGLERLAWYGFRSQLFYRFMAFDLDLSSAPYSLQGLSLIHI